jgi:glycosyltransferase involved in cell wall biosynthesis
MIDSIAAPISDMPIDAIMGCKSLVPGCRSMRLAIVASSAPPRVGGAATWFVSVVAAAARRHAVLAIVPDDADCEALRRAGADSIAGVPAAMLSPIGGIERLGEAIAGAARAFEADLVHVTDAALAFLIPDLCNIGLRVVASVRGPELSLPPWPCELDTAERLQALHNGLAAAQSVGAVGGGVASGGSAVCLRRAVDGERFAPGDRAAARRAVRIEPGRPVLLTLGRLDLQDGHLDVVRALRQLHRQGAVRPLYVIGGEGEGAERIASQVRFFGLDDDVVLCGRVPPSALPLLFQAADVFVLAARDNAALPFLSCATAVLEAAASGLPILATRAGILSRLIDHGVTGILVDRSDPGIVAAAIADLCGDPAQCERFGAAARARVLSAHSLAGLGDDLEALYGCAPPNRPLPRPRPAIRTVPAVGRIAVIMPTFKCRPWLRRAIDSVLSQTHPHIDLFVADDAGDDLDPQLLAQYPSVTFLRMRERTGPYGIVNQLLALTESEYVGFHDADDCCAPDRFAAQVAYLEREAFEACGSWVRLVDCNDDPLGFETYPSHASLAMCRKHSDALLHPSSLWRRSVFATLRGFDDSTRIAADTEFHLRAALFCEIGNVQKFLYNRLIRPGSLTQAPDTGVGSPARRRYIEPVRAAFAEIVAGRRAKPEPGTSLGGYAVGAPDPARIAWWRPGSAISTARHGYAAGIPLRPAG